MRKYLFLIFIFCTNSFAADFYWYTAGYGDQHFSTPKAACEYYVKQSDQSAGGSYTFHDTKLKAVRLDPGLGAAMCDIYYVYEYNESAWNYRHPLYPDAWTYTGVITYRGGSACPVGSTFNTTTGNCDYQNAGQQCDGVDSNGIPNIVDGSGQCVPFLDADQNSQCKNLATQGSKFITFWITFDQDGNPQSPPSPEKFGCKVDVLSVANCKLPAAKSSAGISLAPAQAARCKVVASFTGEASGTGSMAAASPSGGVDGRCGEDQDCTPPDEPGVTEQKPCNYVLDGEGRKVCSSSNYQGDPGSMDCGSVNGKFTCITTPSKSTGTMTDTKVETKSNADGTNTSTKTDTITSTTCGGAGSCVSNTTKVTTVVSKDGNGNTTGSSSSCTGSRCASSTNPDGDGDGLGDCVKDCDKGSPSVGALTKPSSGSFDGMGEEWDQKIAQAKEELGDKLDQLKSAFNPIGDVSLSAGGDLYCPDAPEVLGKKFDICVGVYDSQLSWISLAILVACACIALCIVFI